MACKVDGVSAPGVEELLVRFDRVVSRIREADYSGALRSLRYWDSGYDLGPLPRAIRDQLHRHSLAARFCLTSGDSSGASDHVRDAIALASASSLPQPPGLWDSAAQPSNSAS